MTKQEFLASLRKSSGEYRRVNKISPLRYAGGKTRALGIITEHLPDQMPKKILSPFLGGASLEIAWANNLSEIQEIQGADVFLPLIIFWKEILARPEKLAQTLSEFRLGQQAYTDYKQILRTWYQDPATCDLTDQEVASLFYYNLQLSYGPVFLGWMSKHKRDLHTEYQRLLQRIAEFSCKKLQVHHMTFEQSLRAFPDHYVYADPPYLLGYDSDVFKAIYPNQQGEHHKNFDHDLFRTLIQQRQAGFMISYNNCGTIRDWYKAYPQYYPEWAYTFQQGETRMRDSQGISQRGLRDSKKQGREILIVNNQ